MTSNIGMSDLTRQAGGFGFAQERNDEDSADARKRAEAEYDRVKNQVLDSLKGAMRPELLNRIDKTVVFRPLGMEEIKKITLIELEQLSSRMLKQQNIHLLFDRETVKLVAEKSYDPNQGARLIRRNIQELIEDPLAEQIITGELAEMNEVRVGIENEKITIRQIELAKA